MIFRVQYFNRVLLTKSCNGVIWEIWQNLQQELNFVQTETKQTFYLL